MLVRIVKNWDFPDLMRQTPGGRGVWEGLRFTLAPEAECDFLIVLNELREELEVRCPPENVWTIFQEPYVPGFFPWMRHGHRQYRRVYTCQPPRAEAKYRPSQPMVPWHVGKDFDTLQASAPPQQKQDLVSWVTSDLAVLPGHRLRHAFCGYVQSQLWPELRLWGRGIRPVEDKWDALAPAKYAIAIENYRGLHYWTEKVADCWLAHTLPFYYGCLNLEEYFPAEAFIRIDLTDFAGAVETIRRACDRGEYEKRLPAICEARRIVLEQQQFFPALTREITAAAGGGAARQAVKLAPFRMGLLAAGQERFHRHRAGRSR